MKSFAKPLAARGIELSTPRVKAYRRTIKTPCGRFSQRDAPAYYCSATRTIYWPVSADDGNEAYTFARLGYLGLVAHEFLQLLETSFTEELEKCARLSSGDDEAVDGIELFGFLNQHHFRPEFFQALAMRVEIALQRQDANG